MQIQRQEMPEQDPAVRKDNFNEVTLGYTEEMARIEAMRCLNCATQNCIKGCPVNIKIPIFIEKLIDGDYIAASKTIKEDNVLPRICSRVCPQEVQCESACVLAKRGEAVAIGRLARFVTEYETSHTNGTEKQQTYQSNGKKIAIVGSGPAGLSCAGDLIRYGYEVTVFEALHEFGGVLTYGIPEFRLPKAIVKDEVENLKKMGVDFQNNVVIGMSETIDELMASGYAAVFIAVGAGLPYFLNIPGENLIGIYSANEFLTRVNLMKAYRDDYDTSVFDFKGKVTAVFGGGNTALDSARTALRLGSKAVYIIYRRSEAEIPARKEEIHHAQQEGIQFLFLNSPLEFLADGKMWLNGVRLQKMELGEPDSSGRRRPLPIEGSEYVLDIDYAIVAIGNGSNPIIQQTTPNLSFNKWGNIVADPETMQTNLEGVYAGGDIVSGGATVIRAMGAGRQAAQAMHKYLLSK
ncbi:MAG: NADPH-dependent glutamate synthase [Anaerolineaceae bacterium]|nr:NADPH-dependent glutamate synthase [Anaerolineaceae bacterium]